MANWRKIHIEDDEWHWTISKTGLDVVIREPDKGKCHTILFDDIDPKIIFDDPYMYDCDMIYHSITPGNVKAYIEKNLIVKKESD